MSIRAASRFQHSAPRAALGARLFPEVPAAATIPCGRDTAGGDTSSPPPATFDVTLSADLLLTLRMAAAAEQIGVGEALRRAIACYADGLGLQVLATALDRQLEAPMMLSFIAEMQGYRLVPLEPGENDGDKVTLSDLADLHRADSDVSAVLSDAMADGVIDISERRATRAAIDRKIQRLKAVDRKLARGG